MVDTGLLDTSASAVTSSLPVEASSSDPGPILQVWQNNFFGLFTMPVDVLSIVYAATVALGGIMGYVAKSE